MYLLMTVGTGIGANPSDAAGRLIRICSYAVKSYHPEHIIFFCSIESKELVPSILSACKEIWNYDPPASEICILERPQDFSDCFEIINGVVALYHDYELVMDSSSGTRAMTMAAAIVSFISRITLGYVTGIKNAGLILEGTERINELTLYAAYDRLQLHRAIDQFNLNHYGSAIRLLSNIASQPEEKNIYYGYFSAYWYWDKLNYLEAYRYLQFAPDLSEVTQNNRLFLKNLIDLDEKDESGYPRREQMAIRQQKYLYILADLLNNAKRRIEGERFDDALARLYRVVELLSQVLLLSYGIDDNEDKIRFADLRKQLRNKHDLSMYARKADKHGIIRIGLRYKFMLLEDLGVSGAADWYNRMSGYLQMRNDSILAHGLTPVRGEPVTQMWDEVYQVILEACSGITTDLKELMINSQYPKL